MRDRARATSQLYKDLGRAFDRIEDFKAVQLGRSPEEMQEAILRLQESVAIADAERDLIRRRLERVWPEGSGAGPFMLGLVVGLIAGEGD